MFDFEFLLFCFKFFVQFKIYEHVKTSCLTQLTLRNLSLSPISELF
uniref:Uncharacterized protein n=1 Tax=Arundo donax TaxID=35708 RepID=A0A0A9FMJ1_ARUDO